MPRISHINIQNFNFPNAMKRDFQVLDYTLQTDKLKAAKQLYSKLQNVGQGTTQTNRKIQQSQNNQINTQAVHSSKYSLESLNTADIHDTLLSTQYGQQANHHNYQQTYNSKALTDSVNYTGKVNTSSIGHIIDVIV